MSIVEQPRRVGRYRWIPWVFVGAMTVVVVVNAGLVYFALRRPVGIVAASPYEAGLKFNAVLAQQARQASIGWRVAAGYFPAGDRTGTVAIDIRDKAGTVIRGLQPRITLLRPVDVVDPVIVALAETSPGRYAAMVALPLHGQWDMTIDIDAPHRFTATHRIVVP